MPLVVDYLAFSHFTVDRLGQCSQDTLPVISIVDLFSRVPFMAHSLCYYETERMGKMKKRHNFKPYAIHILAINAIDEETFYLPAEQNAIIVCTNRSNRFIYACRPENILIMDFLDVEDKRIPGAFNRAHARMMIRFVENLSDHVTDIYVCCSKGGSRSPAVAAALLRMSGRKDADVWKNLYYVPNTLVYLNLCREFGFPTTRFSTWIRTHVNNRAFRKAQKGKPCKYERWQIL